MNAATESRPNYVPRAIALLAAIAGIAALYWAREVLLPLALATLGAFLLAPAIRQAEKLRIGRAGSVILVYSVVFALAGTFGWVMIRQAGGVITQLPEHREKIIDRIRAIRAAIPNADSTSSAVAEISKEITGTPSSAPAAQVVMTDQVGPPLPDPIGEVGLNPAPSAAPVKVELVPPSPDLTDLFGTTIAPILNPLLSIGMAALLSMFFLIYREDIRDRIVRICGRAHINVTTAALTDVGTRITRYMLAQSVSNALCGTTIGIGLFFLGVPQAFLWGLLTGILRFVPFIGPAAAAVLTALHSLATSDYPFQPVLVLGYFLLVDIAIANLFEPWYFGSRVGASPTAILLAILFWGWLWGVLGVLLATPMLVCLVVLGKHVQAFENLYVLLSDEPVLEPKMRLYQRLLAADQTEALAIVERAAEESTAEIALGDILLPALAQLESDRQHNMIDAPRIECARTTAEAVIEARLPNAPETLVAPQRPGPHLICALGAGAFDDCLTEVIGRVLRVEGVALHTFTHNAFAGEVAESVAAEKPEAVLLAVVGPRDLQRAELLERRIRMNAPTTQILIGLIQSPGRYWRPERPSRAKQTRLAVGLPQILSELRQMLRIPEPAPRPGAGDRRGRDGENPEVENLTLVQSGQMA